MMEATKVKNYSLRPLFGIVYLLLAFVLTACNGAHDSPPASGKALTSFSINGTTATINEAYKTIGITLPYGNARTALKASFTTNGTSVTIGGNTQFSGITTNDFSNPVVYTVTSSDGSVANYTVTVTVALASSKAITAFSALGVAGVINETQKTIDVILPHNTNPALLSTIASDFTTTGASVSVGGLIQIPKITPNNFANSVQLYVVIAADGSTATYTVWIRNALVTDKAITDFVLADVSGVIDEVHKTIAVIMPFAYPLTSIPATFSTTGNSVSIGGKLQQSGQAGTANNFSTANVTPIIYTVQAADGSVASYSVYVRNAPATSKAITEFVLAGVYGTIDEANKTIAVTMPAGTPLTGLIAYFSTTAAGKTTAPIVPAVTVAGTPQIAGQTANNFTNPLIYTVTDSTGSSVNYTVTATTALASHKTLTAFALDGVNGVITGTNINVTMPPSYPLGNLVATYATTGTTVSVGTQAQTSAVSSNDFTQPVIYTVTAKDGSFANYTVTVNSALGTDSKMSEFSLNGFPGVITPPRLIPNGATQFSTASPTNGYYFDGVNWYKNGNIQVTMKRGTNLDLTNVTANFSSLSKRVHIANATQISGFSPNNFTVNPITYTVESIQGGNNWSLYDVFLDESTCDTALQAPYLVLGDYRLYNNPWGQNAIPHSQFTECMNWNPATGVLASWTWNWPFTANSNGSFNGLTLRAYPGIQYRPAGVAPNIPLSTVTATTTLSHNVTIADTTATVTNLATNALNAAGSFGDFNVAYDIWLDDATTIKTNCYKSEVMIKLAGTWLDVPLVSNPASLPPLNTLTTATTDGLAYPVGSTVINLMSATPLTFKAGDVITLAGDVNPYTIAAPITIAVTATPVTLTTGLLVATVATVVPTPGSAITLVSTPITTDGATYVGAAPPAIGATTINLVSATPVTFKAGDVITFAGDIIHYTIASQVTIGATATPVTLTSGLQTTITAPNAPAITMVSTPKVVTTIAGIPFYLSVGTMRSTNPACTWNYYSFIGYTTRPTNPTTLTAILPLQSFTTYLQTNYPAQVLLTDMITGIEFGTEVAQGSGTATVNSFSVTP